MTTVKLETTRVKRKEVKLAPSYLSLPTIEKLTEFLNTTIPVFYQVKEGTRSKITNKNAKDILTSGFPLKCLNDNSVPISSFGTLHQGPVSNGKFKVEDHGSKSYSYRLYEIFDGSGVTRT